MNDVAIVFFSAIVSLRASSTDAGAEAANIERNSKFIVCLMGLQLLHSLCRDSSFLAITSNAPLAIIAGQNAEYGVEAGLFTLAALRIEVLYFSLASCTSCYTQ